MVLNRMFLSASAVALVLGTTGISVDAAQREGHARPRQGSGESRDADRRHDDNQRSQDDRQGNRRERGDRDDRNRGSNERAQRDDNHRSRTPAPVWRGDDRGRHDEFRRQAPRHYYGSGGRFSVYFGVGSGYRYGAPYSGRVYGYVGQGYGVRRAYGDVRLQVRPRNAEVFVDGYYAGVVDDFDGVFQRLTLEVGPHAIEIAAPGLEPQYFDIYVDPTRTVDLHGDLLRDRQY